MLNSSPITRRNPYRIDQLVWELFCPPLRQLVATPAPLGQRAVLDHPRPDGQQIDDSAALALDEIAT